MKLATYRDGSRDGRLVVVRRDGLAAAPADARWPSLQRALDDWSVAEPELRQISDRLDQGDVSGAVTVDETALCAPLPRAYEWIDGSAYLNHIALVRKARGAELPPTIKTDPLIYQGGSSEMLGPRDPMFLHDPTWGLDFEAELGVILGDVPVGTQAADAAHYIRLIVLLNDWTFRTLVPAELGKGFGFFQSKPATSFAPFAVTPDELGESWFECRAYLQVRSTFNEQLIGACDAGPEMHFSFADLIQHIAKTRSFCAGTILGSGTVSNADRAAGVSCLVERRMIETIDTGAATSPLMTLGSIIRIEAALPDGTNPFGVIQSRVLPPRGRQ